MNEQLLMSLIDPKKHGAYLAFFFTCIIVMYDKMKHIHHRLWAVVFGGFVLLCGAFIYKDNAGLFVLTVAMFLVITNAYILALKSQVRP